MIKEKVRGETPDFLHIETVFSFFYSFFADKAFFFSGVVVEYNEKL